jgi:KTSC domain
MLHVSQMERTPVDSSSVASVGYDQVSYELEIEFLNGRTYRYLQVPPAAYRLLLQAPSVGEYVNRVIKPRFAAKSV